MSPVLFLFTLSLFVSHNSSLAAGSYVALTVLGRPPGLPQIPLEEEAGEKEEGGNVKMPLSLSVPQSPTLPRGEQCSLQEHITSPKPDGVRRKKVSSLTER